MTTPSQRFSLEANADDVFASIMGSRDAQWRSVQQVQQPFAVDARLHRRSTVRELYLIDIFLDIYVASEPVQHFNPDNPHEAWQLVAKRAKAARISIAQEEVGTCKVSLYFETDRGQWGIVTERFGRTAPLARGEVFIADLWRDLVDVWAGARTGRLPKAIDAAEPDDTRREAGNIGTGEGESLTAKQGASAEEAGEKVDPLAVLSNPTIMREYYGDYSVATAQDIIRIIPKAWALHCREGGRWGPGRIGDVLGLHSATVGRYLKAFHEAGIREVNGIDNPYRPRARQKPRQ